MPSSEATKKKNNHTKFSNNEILFVNSQHQKNKL